MLHLLTLDQLLSDLGDDWLRGLLLAGGWCCGVLGRGTVMLFCITILHTSWNLKLSGNSVSSTHLPILSVVQYLGCHGASSDSSDSE